VGALWKAKGWAVIAQMLTLWAGVGVAVAGGALAVMRAVVAYRRGLRDC
jgi:hypothetical protein